MASFPNNDPWQSHEIRIWANVANKNIFHSLQNIHLTKSIDINYSKVVLFIWAFRQDILRRESRNACFMVWVCISNVQNRNGTDHMLNIWSVCKSDIVFVCFAWMESKPAALRFPIPQWSNGLNIRAKIIIKEKRSNNKQKLFFAICKPLCVLFSWSISMLSSPISFGKYSNILNETYKQMVIFSLFRRIPTIDVAAKENRKCPTFVVSTSGNFEWFLRVFFFVCT